MKRIRQLIFALCALPVMGVFHSCTSDLSDLSESAGRPGPAVAEVSIEDFVDGSAVFGSRTVVDNSDRWTIERFTVGDQVGMYAIKGREDGSTDTYDLPVENGVLYCESATSISNYRFSNPAIVLNPSTVGANFSMLYYPYYKDMPPTINPEVVTNPLDTLGMPLRRTDSDGIEKCIDFMTTKNTKITVSGGVMKPAFEHKFSVIYVQRGNGFADPRNPSLFDGKVYVVMKKPLTNVRITQDKPTTAYNVTLQNYSPDSGSDLTTTLDGRLNFEVDKNCVWEGWQAGPYKGDPQMNYVVVPPGDIYFLLIQDDYGKWCTVNDFYMSTAGKKDAEAGKTYILRVSMEGVNVVARPISITPWDEEVEITDSRDEGINDAQEYFEFVTRYNTYIQNNRDPEYEEDLKPFGKGVLNTLTGRTSWTFYINNDITFPDGEFPQIIQLDDVIEGSSKYSNYFLKNIEATLIQEMTANGALRQLDFNDIYMVRPAGNTQPFSPLIGTLNGGTIENCSITGAIVITSVPVGIVAGTATGATIIDCTFSGDMIGTSTAPEYNGLFGSASGNITLTNVKTSGLQFIEN